MTVTRRGSKSRSRSPAFSARHSRRKAKRPLSTMTTKMASPSCGMPPRIAKPPRHDRKEVDKLREEAPPQPDVARALEQIQTEGLSPAFDVFTGQPRRF